MSLSENVSKLATRPARSKASAGVTLLVCLAISALCVLYGKGIKVDTNLTAMLPSTAPAVAALDELRDRKGTGEPLKVAIEEPDVEVRAELIAALGDEIESWPEAKNVHRGRDQTPLRDHALYLLELEELQDLEQSLVKERQKAVARSVAAGVGGGDGGDPDLEAVIADDDWDSWDEEDDEGGEEEGGKEEGEQDEGEQDEPVDIRTWLEEQKQSLKDDGRLTAEEVDAIWPDENEQGRVEWKEQILAPFVNRDGTVQLVKADLTKPSTDVSFAKDISDRVAAFDERMRAAGKTSDSTRIAVVGAYDVTKEINEILVDAKKATVLSAILVFAVLVLGFRDLRGIVCVLVPMVIATCITLAAARLILGQLNALTVFLFAVLFGMGVDFSVHLYAQRRALGPGTQDSWSNVVSEHLRPLFWTMVTTAGSLLVLQVAEFKAFREFGLISAVGVLICFIAALVLVPVVHRLVSKDPPTVAPGVAAQEVELAAPPKRKPMSVVRMAVLGVLAVVAIYGAPKLALENDIRNLKSKNAPEDKIDHKESTGRCSKSVVVIGPDGSETDEMVGRLTTQKDEGVRVEKINENGKPWIANVYSANSLMPTAQDAKRPLIENINQQTNDFLAELEDLDDEAREYETHLQALERLSKSDPMVPNDLPSWARAPFEEKDGTLDRLAVLCLNVNSQDINALIIARDSLNEESEGLDISFADSRFVFADLLTVIRADSRTLPLIALGVILIFIALDLRKVKGTAACFGALALGLGLAIATMALIPIRLNFFNLVVMPAVIGLGIDASIHLWHARDSATLGATGHASIIAALTTVAGFAGLLVAHHPGLRSIGEVGVMAVLVCVSVAFLALFPGPKVK